MKMEAKEIIDFLMERTKNEYSYHIEMCRQEEDLRDKKIGGYELFDVRREKQISGTRAWALEGVLFHILTENGQKEEISKYLAWTVECWQNSKCTCPYRC